MKPYFLPISRAMVEDGSAVALIRQALEHAGQPTGSGPICAACTITDGPDRDYCRSCAAVDEPRLERVTYSAI